MERFTITDMVGRGGVSLMEDASPKVSPFNPSNSHSIFSLSVSSNKDLTLKI